LQRKITCDTIYVNIF